MEKSFPFLNRLNTTNAPASSPTIPSNIQEISLLLQQTPKSNQQPEKKIISHNKFTPEDDERLKQLVLQFGTMEWRQISRLMGDRSARQCRDRWKNYLNPSVNNAPWTEYEDNLLDQKVAELGRKWSIIAKFFPGRTDINIKNRYASHAAKKFRDDDDIVYKQNQIQVPIPQ